MNIISSIATIAAFLLLIVVLSRKDMVKSVYFPFLLLAVLFYLLGNHIEIISITEDVARIGFKVRFIGIPFIPTLWYLCIREFCGLTVKKWTSILLFMLVPVILVYLAFTWETNHLLFSGISYPSGNYHGNPRLTPGPLFPLRLAYQYSINMAGLLTLAWNYRNGTPRFKKQISLFLFSALIPIFNISTYLLEVKAYSVDLTPYALVASMVLFTYALYRFGVINRASILKDNALNQINEGILLFDHDGIFMDSNRAARGIFHQLYKVPLGTSIADMNYLPFNSAKLNEKSTESVNDFSYATDGTLRTFGVSIAPIHFKREAIGYSVIMNNISSLRKELNDLEEKSAKDGLTGLYNRAYLYGLGEDWVKNACYTCDPFSVIMFDIDFFKKVNDTYGHLFGDYVLKEIAQVCSIDLRQTDVFGRYGGEEFCVLLFNTPLAGACKKAESMRMKVTSHRFVHDEKATEVTASFGVATYGKSIADESFNELLKRADNNLYRAKAEGRNRVCCH